MNTMPTINVTAEGPEVGVATARLILQHALHEEAQQATVAIPRVPEPVVVVPAKPTDVAIATKAS
jgi:hypothetical protein